MISFGMMLMMDIIYQPLTHLAYYKLICQTAIITQLYYSLTHASYSPTQLQICSLIHSLSNIHLPTPSSFFSYTLFTLLPFLSFMHFPCVCITLIESSKAITFLHKITGVIFCPSPVLIYTQYRAPYRLIYVCYLCLPHSYLYPFLCV